MLMLNKINTQKEYDQSLWRLFKSVGMHDRMAGEQQALDTSEAHA